MPAPPKALKAVSVTLGATLAVAAADVAELRWQTAPGDAELYEVRLGAAEGPLVAYFHARRGTWRAVSWPAAPPAPLAIPPEVRRAPGGTAVPAAEDADAGEPPELAELAEHAPERPPESPKEQYGRAVSAEARRQADQPQPVPFFGVIADALVFGTGAHDERLRPLTHAAAGDAEPLGVLTGDGLARAPEFFRAASVVEWGPFAYVAPIEAGLSALAVCDAETAIVRAIDAAVAGPHQTLLVHRDSKPPPPSD